MLFDSIRLDSIMTNFIRKNSTYLQARLVQGISCSEWTMQSSPPFLPLYPIQIETPNCNTGPQVIAVHSLWFGQSSLVPRPMFVKKMYTFCIMHKMQKSWERQIWQFGEGRWRGQSWIKEDCIKLNLKMYYPAVKRRIQNQEWLSTSVFTIMV